MRHHPPGRNVGKCGQPGGAHVDVPGEVEAPGRTGGHLIRFGPGSIAVVDYRDGAAAVAQAASANVDVSLDTSGNHNFTAVPSPLCLHADRDLLFCCVGQAPSPHGPASSASRRPGTRANSSRFQPTRWSGDRVRAKASVYLDGRPCRGPHSRGPRCCRHGMTRGTSRGHGEQ